ncbi:DNA-binding domain-containing protein [Rhabdonatronobacter sediminivivens]|uniref:DNA-binding domain-containing protein n=1 Tax=Rhabdonatronobacter sediminivivens TaxID=2743469 RepID=UPI0015D069DE|nr:DNA-binding domain-containing protein [Rhabdonatronobacter sediminivivens]
MKGVDPINFAPALLDDYGKCGSARAGISDDAWAFFMATIRNAYKDFPLKQAWRDTRNVERGMGWAVPSFPAFYRRWQQLPEAHRLHARLAERTYATLSRVIDARARSGPRVQGRAYRSRAGGRAKNRQGGPDVVPVPFDMAEQVLPAGSETAQCRDGPQGAGRAWAVL